MSLMSPFPEPPAPESPTGEPASLESRPRESRPREHRSPEPQPANVLALNPVPLTVVVPCRNEERALPGLHEALVTALAGAFTDYEVVLVDDGSTDRTLRAARGIAGRDPRFRYLALSRHFGKEAAVLAGLECARGDRVVIMDADLQHPPDLLPRMSSLMGSGYDQVVARRSRQGEGRVRAGLSRLYYRVLNRVSEVRVPDGVGDFRMLSRRAVDALLSLRESHRFSKGLFSWIGFDTATVAYRDAARTTGGSKWTPARLFDHAVDGLVGFNSAPLRSSVHFGLLLLVLSSGAVVGSACGVGVPGRVVPFAGLVGLGGVQLVCLGVLGEYVGKVLVEAKRRPPYLVKEASREPAGPRGKEARCLPRSGASQPSGV